MIDLFRLAHQLLQQIVSQYIIFMVHADHPLAKTLYLEPGLAVPQIGTQDKAVILPETGTMGRARKRFPLKKTPLQPDLPHAHR